MTMMPKKGLKSFLVTLCFISGGAIDVFAQYQAATLAGTTIVERANSARLQLLHESVRYLSGYVIGNLSQVGVYSNLTSILDVPSDGIIITTGNIGGGSSITNASISYGDPEFGEVFGGPSEPDLESLNPGFPGSSDSAGIVLYVVPSNSTLNIKYTFASEEYFLDFTGYTNGSYPYADVFGFFIGAGTNIPAVGMTNNICRLPGGDAVAITTINQFTNSHLFYANIVTNEAGEILKPGIGGSAVYPEIPFPFSYNGGVIGLYASTPVEPGVPQTFKIVVSDIFDSRVDTAVFLERFSITSGADVQADVSAPITPIDSGGTSFYTVVVGNFSPATAEDVVVTNYFPEGVLLLSNVVSRGTVITNSPTKLIWAIGTMSNGVSESWTLYGVFTNGGVFTNVAEVYTSTGDYDLSNNVDRAEITAGALPFIDIQKTVAPYDVFPGLEIMPGTNGTPVSYWLIAQNNGSESLTNVVIADDALSFTTNAPILDPGGIITVRIDGVISSDLTNWANASGQAAGSAVISSNSAIVDLVSPGISLTKTVGTGTFPGGDLATGTNGTPVTYWFEVVNSGDISLTNVVLSDALLSLSTNIGVLSAWSTVTVSSASAITSSQTNWATVSGEALGVVYVSSNSASVNLVSPGISLSKTVGAGAFPGGELVTGTNGTPVTYWFVVANTGDVLLTEIELVDAQLGLTNALGTLNAGQSVTVEVSSVISHNLTNIANVTGIDTLGIIREAEDTASVGLMSPGISLAKTVGTGGFPGGEFVAGTNDAPVIYWFVIRNTGDVDFVSVELSDPQLGFTTNFASLAAGRSVTAQFSSVISQTLTNTASVSGVDPLDNTLTAEDSAVVILVEPGISLSKTVGTGSSPGGELATGTNGTPVTYWFTVVNNGDVGLTNVVLIDPLLSLSTNIGVLSAGSTVTISRGATITSSLTNWATVSGESLGVVYASSNSASVNLVSPGISLSKTVGVGAFPGGEVATGTNGTPVTYWFAVVNTGDVSLANVVLSDPLLSLSTNIGFLSAGSTVTVSRGSTITSSLTNWATVSGEALGVVYVSSNSASVGLVSPGISLSKTVGTGAFPGGELATGTNGTPLTYWFVVSNAGNVTLTNVVLTDPLLSFTNKIGTLVQGQSVTASVGSVISGDFTNVATVIGYDPSSNQVIDSDEARTSPGIPELNIVLASWRLHYATGLFEGTLTVANGGSAAFPTNYNYWFALATEAESRLWYTTNALPDSRLYLNLTTQVQQRLWFADNMNGVWDPSETITLTNIWIYHLRRVNPSRYVNPATAFEAGLLHISADINSNFSVSSQEVTRAVAQWQAGEISDETLLHAVRLRDASAYQWDSRLGTWRRLESR